MDRRSFEQDALPDDLHESVTPADDLPDADRRIEADTPCLPPQPTAPAREGPRSKSQGVMLLGLFWLLLGLIGLTYYLYSRGSVGAAPQQESAAAAFAAPTELPVATEAARPAASIVGVKIAVDATRAFDAIEDIRTIAGGPTPLGIAVRHQGYGGSDSIRVELFSNGRFVNACSPYQLNSSALNTYWCQFPEVAVGSGQFRVAIDGVIQGRYDFIVRARSDERPATAAAVPVRNDLSENRVDPSMRARPAVAEPAPEAVLVTCILPSGQEVRTSYRLCRQQSGVIY